MDAAGCQRALADALKRQCGADYRKSMDGLYALVDRWRADAGANVARLRAHHESIGNDKPSQMNPGSRVGEIFDEVSPYLDADSIGR